MSNDGSDRSLRGLLAPLLAVPSLPGRLETERARILSTILSAGALVSGLMMLLTPLWRDEPASGVIGYGLTFVLHIAHLWLVRRGYARAAARSFSILFFLLVTTMVYLYGGVRGLGGFVYPLAALFAGLTWSAWAAVGVAIAASVTALAMALAETGGLMTSVAPAPSAGGAWAVITASVAMTAVMLFVALRVIRASTAEAIESERQRRVLESELARAKRMEALGQLASGVAHDFNNMLTGIIGHAELIDKKSGGTNDISRHARLIVSSGEKAARITRELLTFSRKRDQVVEDVHVNEVVQNVVAILDRSINQSIRVETALDADPDTVHGDPAQMEMAVLNLAVNARDAVAVGGHLAFRTSSSESEDGSAWIQIEVSDDGVGMSRDLRERIFEPYFTTKPPGRGTGLGLSAVYGTVQNHHGRIDVESALGEGTTFTMSFPAATDSLEPAAVVGSPAHAGQPVSVLTIDDDEVVLELLRGLLDDMGHSVRTATNGDEGLAIYDSNPSDVDLVIVDLLMPGLSGREVLERLRKRGGRPLPVIVTSGAVDELLQAPELGELVRFLPKPYRRTELESMIVELTALRATTSQST